jgi:hypothetical protein
VGYEREIDWNYGERKDAYGSAVGYNRGLSVASVRLFDGST